MYMELIVWIVSMAVFFALKTMRKKRINFGARVMAAMGAGLVAGLVFKENALVVQPVGRIFTSLIKMIVLPLVATSLTVSIMEIENVKKLKSIGIKSVAFLLGMTGVAALTGALVANVIGVGEGVNLALNPEFVPRSIPSLGSVFVDMIPKNPVKSMADGKVISVVIFTVMVGLSGVYKENKEPGSTKAFKEFAKSFLGIISVLTKKIIGLAPYGVYALMASMAAKNGASTLMPLVKVIAAVYLSAIIHMALTYGGLLAIVGKVNPLRFFKKIYPAQVMAFTTQSSYGTLPLTIKSLVERAGVSEKIASFTGPLGANLGMSGCGGFYPAIVAVFVANVYGIDLSLNHYVLLVVTAIIGSVGITGVPGTASIAATIMLTNLGLPLEGLAMVLGIDAVLDMARTMINVTGASVAAFLVARTEGEVDMDVFMDRKETLVEAAIA